MWCRVPSGESGGKTHHNMRTHYHKRVIKLFYKMRQMILVFVYMYIFYFILSFRWACRDIVEGLSQDIRWSCAFWWSHKFRFKIANKQKPNRGDNICFVDKNRKFQYIKCVYCWYSLKYYNKKIKHFSFTITQCVKPCVFVTA